MSERGQKKAVDASRGDGVPGHNAFTYLPRLLVRDNFSRCPPPATLYFQGHGGTCRNGQEILVFQKIDCVILRVSDLDEGLAFYSHTLGHKLLWRTPDAAGLAMADTDAELVLHTKTGPEVDLLVPELAPALARFEAAGGERVCEPFELPIGMAAVVRDPFGNVLTMLDQSKGTFMTDAEGNVTGVEL
jgi:catechol 2,3-dioxygenase-like lactoylglutathione lyase family enzyme